MRLEFALVSSFVAAALTAAAPQPVGQTTGLAIPISKRSGLVNVDKSVNIEALNSQVTSIKAKILRGFSNFEKNTGSPHPSALKETKKRATSPDPLTDSNDMLWYGSISVGNPSNSFTGEVSCTVGGGTTYPFWQWTSIQARGMFPDLFLPGPECTSNCDGHAIYDPRSSMTSRVLGTTFKDSYGDGSSVSGEQYTDTVAIAGLTVENQVFGVASEYSDGFVISLFPSDGVMGMAFPSLAFTQSPVFQSLVAQGQTDNPVFSFKLSAGGAELYLGGANSELYTGDFSYTPVTNKGFWEVNMDGIQGNGQTVMSNIDCIIDTGTTLVVGDPSQVASLYTALGGTDASSTAGPGFYTLPCASFPDISFTFGGTSFPISADTLNLGLLSEGSSDCVSGIVGQDLGSSFWVVGDVFLRNVYTTFDVGNSQIGFAQLA